MDTATELPTCSNHDGKDPGVGDDANAHDGHTRMKPRHIKLYDARSTIALVGLPDRTWKRPPGRPRNKCMHQISTAISFRPLICRDISVVINDLWFDDKDKDQSFEVFSYPGLFKMLC